MSRRRRPDTQQLPLFQTTDMHRPAPVRRERRALRTPYLDRILRFLVYHRVATVGQVHREFFAGAGRRRQYCAHLLKSFAEEGFVLARPIKRTGSGRPMMAYQITAAGAEVVGVTATERMLRRLPSVELIARLQLTEMIQRRADEGWQPIRADQAYRMLKRWALKSLTHTVVDRSVLMLLEKQPDETPMRHNVLVRGREQGVPAEVRVILQVSEHRNLRANLKALPSFYGMPPIVFEVVAAEADRLPKVRAMLDRLVRKRKFRYSIELVDSFLASPLTDRLSREAIVAGARVPAGWEPWLRDIAT